MRADPYLIFDIGVCNGDDSAYYLHKGYRVVGVEANPLLLPALEERFAEEIRDGRYQLVGMGIAAREGEELFWVCDDWPEWSSFDRSIASRNGSRHHGVPVPTCRFGALLQRFGMPFYCKIDIEGNEGVCLEDMSASARPHYLSIEMIVGDRQIEPLADLGFTRFKIISQRTLRQPPIAYTRFKAELPAAARWVLTSAEAKLARHRRDGSWHFPPGTSGPFGENTRGRWLGIKEALELDCLLQKRSDLTEWHDIHAAAG